VYSRRFLRTYFSQPIGSIGRGGESVLIGGKKYARRNLHMASGVPLLTLLILRVVVGPIYQASLATRRQQCKNSKTGHLRLPFKHKLIFYNSGMCHELLEVLFFHRSLEQLD